jgi:hypothetical protein
MQKNDVQFVKNEVVVKEYGLKGASVVDSSSGTTVPVDDVVESLWRLIRTSLDEDRIQVTFFNTTVWVYGATNKASRVVSETIVQAKGFGMTDAIIGRLPINDLVLRVCTRITLARIDALVASATPG